ncbi:MAG: phenylalanine--tRNA ligase subunit alpha [Bacillota bacterium]
MKDKLEQIRSSAQVEIAAAQSMQELEQIRIKYLGKKGELTSVLRGMGELSSEERPLVGKIANEVREAIEDMLTGSIQNVKNREKNARLAMETIDVTMPGKCSVVGNRHPLTLVLDEIKDIFLGMGFKIAEGPEVERVHYNFDALNVPKNHPARDITDTFYISDDILLRTQTSPVQIRTMEKSKPPIRIISPGRCFRSDTPDATHSPMFHQVEGLVVDKNITLGDLKGTLDTFAKRLFGIGTKTKFRPHHFPFTEPSAEMDVTCFKCQGNGCRMCGGSGWIEILGSGMVHPNVLKICGIDPEEYSGFAFGMGLDRITMLKYEIDDIRLLFENDMRFIKQF